MLRPPSHRRFGPKSDIDKITIRPLSQRRIVYWKSAPRGSHPVAHSRPYALR